MKNIIDENEAIQLKEGISILSPNAVTHSKAAEEYIEVRFPFGNQTWNLWIPIVYRRNGLYLEYPGADAIDNEENLAKSNDLYDYLNKASESIPKSNKEINEWILSQVDWWNNEHSDARKRNLFSWDWLITLESGCVLTISIANTNPQRRIQAIKDYSYTLATKTYQTCSECHKTNTTFLMMLPIECDGVGNGYEQWSPTLRKKIIRIFGQKDVYDNKKNAHLLPDHKFSEARWDQNTIAKNPDNMSEEPIRAKFQLLTNQHNEEKREVCRKCVLTGKHPYPFGINTMYRGSEEWSDPKYGKEAENGCKGCCWYDFAIWREALKRDDSRFKDENQLDII